MNTPLPPLTSASRVPYHSIYGLALLFQQKGMTWGSKFREWKGMSPRTIQTLTEKESE